MKKVLFVCHGNVCRSAMAEAILRKLIKEKHLESAVSVDSAATSTEELGNQPHPAVRRILDDHNVDYSNQYARQIEYNDFKKYDLIIGMDHENIHNLIHWAPKNDLQKIHLYLDILDDSDGVEISDPWYTGEFDKTFHQINEAMPKWLEYILAI